jgi:hypothetical protein
MAARSRPSLASVTGRLPPHKPEQYDVELLALVKSELRHRRHMQWLRTVWLVRRLRWTPKLRRRLDLPCRARPRRYRWWTAWRAGSWCPIAFCQIADRPAVARMGKPSDARRAQRRKLAKQYGLARHHLLPRPGETQAEYVQRTGLWLSARDIRAVQARMAASPTAAKRPNDPPAASIIANV